MSAIIRIPDEPTSLYDDGVVSVESAAEFLDVSRATLYRMMDAGDLPYSKIRGGRRIPRRALVELLERSKRGPVDGA